MAQSIIITDSFSSLARPLRQHFEAQFENPRDTHRGRFVWDYWHVPNQYTALRTPAYTYFPQKLYRDFHNQLVWWGRRNLGCHDISPPWMSCYVDGCRQEIHGDVPHGPWAFVYSLTPWRGRRFSGGETFLMKDGILSYWSSPESHRGLESEQVFRLIPAQFNRLTVFDPRIPHGVKRVEGVHDPREGRLVIHGWFVQPRPFIEGPLATRDLQSAINEMSGELQHLFNGGLYVQGMMSLHFQVKINGRATRPLILSSSVRGIHSTNQNRAPQIIFKTVRTFLEKYQFKKQSRISHVTLPLNFELG